jgi:PAS domain S-box-containing protein
MSTPSEHHASLEIERLRQRLRALRRSVEDMDQLLERYIAAEQALRESEERFRLMVAGVKDYAIFMLDTNGQIITWNAGAQRINGYTQDEIVGQHFSIFYPPEDHAKPAMELRVAIAEGRYEEEGWRVRKDGSRFWANVLITALYDDNGNLRGFGKVTRDMTRAKLAEEALRQSEERFRMMVAGVKDYAIFMLDTDGQIITWNAGAQRINGYTQDEIVGQHFSIFYPPEDHAKPAMELRVAIAEGRYEEEGWRVRKDGSRFWANVLITALYDDDGTLRGFGKVTRDMTRAKLVEEALRQSEERFRLLVAGVKDYAIFMLDTDGQIITWNAGAQRIKGYTQDEIIGQHFSIFYPPEDRARAATELRVAIAEGRYEEEGWRMRKDGTRFWANVVLTPLYDDDGTLRGFGKVTRDMTERKQAEEQREQLRASEQRLAREREERAQMEAVMRLREEFLTITAHELRTPITSMLGYAELLQRRSEQSDLHAERLLQPVRVVIEQAQRLDRLTASLLDFTRLEHGQLVLNRQTIDLRSVVARVIEQLHMLMDHHTLSVTYPSEPLVIEGDQLRLEQIMYNVLQNAIKYSPTGGNITIKVRHEQEQAVVTITDQGVGIAAHDLPHVFDRFYRAESTIQQHMSGIGLGLYIVKELVALHYGTINVHSVTGVGSTFTIAFPLKA